MSLKSKVKSVVSKVKDTKDKILSKGKTTISKVVDAYKKTDTQVFRGALPFGTSTTQAKAELLVKKNKEQDRLNWAKMQQQKIEDRYKLEKLKQDARYEKEKLLYKQDKDLNKVSWYENLGIARSPEERSYQEATNKIIYLEKIPQILDRIPEDTTQNLTDLGNFLNTDIPTTENTTTNWKTYVIFGLIGVGLALYLKK